MLKLLLCLCCSQLPQFWLSFSQLCNDPSSFICSDPRTEFVMLDLHLPNAGLVWIYILMTWEMNLSKFICEMSKEFIVISSEVLLYCETVILSETPIRQKPSSISFVRMVFFVCPCKIPCFANVLLRFFGLYSTLLFYYHLTTLSIIVIQSNPEVTRVACLQDKQVNSSYDFLFF